MHRHREEIMHKTNIILKSLLSASVLAFAVPALAQEAPAADDAAEGEIGLDEIVVTAQQREQSLQLRWEFEWERRVQCSTDWCEQHHSAIECGDV